MELDRIRREYLIAGLRRKALCDSPFDQFHLWLEQAIKSDIPDATAMTLATVSDTGMPSQRIVLLKYSNQQGFIFFTHYGSQKAQEISQNPQASVHFPWHLMERQVLIQGHIEKIETQESQAYFYSRPKESQIAASISPQSQVIESRALLEQDFNEQQKKLGDSTPECPDNWGGYRLIPNYFEFWQGGEHRLHDRFSYRLNNTAWHIDRLAP